MSKEQFSQPLGKRDKFKQLLVLEKQLNTQFKTETSLVRLGSKVGLILPSICTQLPTFDWNVIGTGGIPRGRIIELYGPESSGKTTLALHIIGCEQKNEPDAICAFVDAEHALDPSWAAQLGVNVDDLVVSQPGCGEEALETVAGLIESKTVSLIVIDSVAALTPRAELDGVMGDSFMGLQARLMSQAMRKLNGMAATNNVTVLFINQLRQKIGVIYGSPEVTTGGTALKFYASLRLDVRRRKPIKEGETIVGHEIEVKAAKNKVGVPFRSSIIRLLYSSGFDIMSDVIEYAISLGVVEQAGAWLKFKGKSYHKDGLIEVIDEVKAEIAKSQQAQREQ